VGHCFKFCILFMSLFFYLSHSPSLTLSLSFFLSLYLFFLSFFNISLFISNFASTLFFFIYSLEKETIIPRSCLMSNLICVLKCFRHFSFDRKKANFFNNCIFLEIFHKEFFVATNIKILSYCF